MPHFSVLTSLVVAILVTVLVLLLLLPLRLCVLPDAPLDRALLVGAWGWGGQRYRVSG